MRRVNPSEKPQYGLLGVRHCGMNPHAPATPLGSTLDTNRHRTISTTQGDE